MNPHVSARALAWGWTIFLLATCWIPRDNVPKEDRLPSPLQIPHLDKWIHGTLFAGFALTWGRVRGASRADAARVLGAGLVLAVLTEAVQGHPRIGRTTDAADAAADLAGLCLGWIAWRAISSRRVDRASGPSGGP